MSQNGNAAENRGLIPSWLTKGYLQDVLRKSAGKSSDLEVRSFTAAPPVAAGNNYASLILRATVECVEKGITTEKSLIIKTVHFDDESAELLSEYGAHKNEMIMYADILPRVKELLDSIGDSDEVGPNAVFIDKQHQAMILPDLKKLQYSVADRRVGLDWDHMQIIFRKHAKLHACSIVLAEQGETFPSFQRGLFSEDFHGFDIFFTNMFSELGDEMKSWKGYERYAEKWKTVAENVIEQGVDCFRRRPNQTLVLNHGDSWTNNMMFKYDDKGKVLDATLIDFQIAVYASPVFDLLYFFYTSATDEVKFDHRKFHEMLRIYHAHLKTTLELLKAKTKPPTLFDLHQEFYQRSFYVLVSNIIFPIMINEKEEDAAIANLIGTNETAKAFRKQLFAYPRFIKTFKEFLPLWEAQGLLDPLK